MIFRKDPFGHYLIIKRLVLRSIGIISYLTLRFLNKLRIEGAENLENLGKHGILIVSNHQTYFADVVGIYHVISRKRSAFSNGIKNPLYLLAPMLNCYFIAAEETMKSGWIPKIVSYAGSISIRRIWRDKDKDVKRQVRFTDITNIGMALKDGWVITFPQGTTKPNAPGRRGVTYIIKKFNPIVVPVVIDGFQNAFHRKKLRLNKLGSRVTIKFKPPLEFNANEGSNEMLSKIMNAIEQSAAPEGA
ncbi:MAG: lysophospholipid acyltransferase family protein [candidate division Zixibacteria bacterium]